MHLGLDAFGLNHVVFGHSCKLREFGLGFGALLSGNRLPSHAPLSVEGEDAAHFRVQNHGGITDLWPASEKLYCLGSRASVWGS